MSPNTLSTAGRAATPAACRGVRHLSLILCLLGLLFEGNANAQAAALHGAALADDAARIQALVAQGSPVDAINKDGMWPLLIACTYGNQDAVRALLKGGANVNLANVSGYTALHEASFQGYEPIVEMLIAAGADIDKRDISNDTALSYAEQQNHPAVVQLLKRHGARH